MSVEHMSRRLALLRRLGLYAIALAAVFLAVNVAVYQLNYSARWSTGSRVTKQLTEECLRLVVAGYPDMVLTKGNAHYYWALSVPQEYLPWHGVSSPWVTLLNDTREDGHEASVTVSSKWPPFGFGEIESTSKFTEALALKLEAACPTYSRLDVK